MLTLPEYQKKFDSAMGEKRRLSTQLKEATSNREKTEKGILVLEKALALIQTKAQETQNQLSIRVEDIVQLAIDTCFPNVFQFQLKFEPKRGKTEANLDLLQDGFSVDPLTTCGGGVADIDAFGLRISSWSLEPNNNVMLFDEPFRFLSENLKPLAGEVMKELSKRLGLQFIIVTHDPNIINVADRVITTTIRNGVSRVKISDKD